MLKKINIVSFFFNTIITTSVSLITVILITQNYTKLEFGLFSYVQNIFLISYTLCFSNYYFYLTKELKNNYNEKSQIITSCLMITFLGSLMGYLIIFFTLTISGIERNIIELVLILNLSLIILPFGLFYYDLLVLEKYKDIFYITLFTGILSLAIKILLIINKFSISILILSFVFDSLIFVLLIIIFYKKNNINFKFSPSYIITLKVLKNLSLYPLLAFLTLASLRIDTLMIKEFLDLNILADYSVCSKIVIILILFLSNVLKFFYPLLQNKNKDEMFLNIFFYCNIISLISVVFILFFSKIILTFFGSDYVLSYKLLNLLSLNIYFVTIADLLVLKSYANNQYKKIILFYSVLIVLNIILNYFFVQYLKIYGVALATVLSTIMSILIFYYNNLLDMFLNLKLSKIRKIDKSIFKI